MSASGPFEPFERMVCSCGKPGTVGTYAGIFCADCASKLPPQCDFCDFAAPEWRYPCASFVESLYLARGQTLISASESDWGACLTCHVLIQHDQWDALIDRVLSGGPTATGDLLARALMRSKLTDLYAQFRAHRSGSPYRVDAHGNRIEGGA